MNKTKKKSTNIQQILVDTEGLKELCGVGRYTAVKIGTAAGARVQVGARVLWNTKKLKEYLDNINEG